MRERWREGGGEGGRESERQRQRRAGAGKGLKEGGGRMVVKENSVEIT